MTYNALILLVFLYLFDFIVFLIGRRSALSGLVVLGDQYGGGGVGQLLRIVQVVMQAP